LTLKIDLILCDVINYNNVISAANSHESVKNARFTDVQTVENIVVQYVEAGNFWDYTRMLQWSVT